MLPPRSRQQRRAAEKDARQSYEKRGLPPGGGIAPLVVHTQSLIRILSNRHSNSRASDAAEMSLKVFERSATIHPAEIPLQCQRGCSFCCYDIVAATAPEVFRIARHVLGQPGPSREAALRRIEAAHAATAGAGPEDRQRHRRPCGMLEAGVCSGYAARPLVCRAANSGSVRACEDAFHDGVTRIPVASVPFVLRDAHLLCLLAALQAARLDDRAYELNHALWLAVSLPDAEARWLAGEDFFAPVQTTPAAREPMMALVQSLAAEASAGSR